MCERVNDETIRQEEKKMREEATTKKGQKLGAPAWIPFQNMIRRYGSTE